MSPTASPPTTWNSLLSAAMQAAKVLVGTGRGNNDRQRRDETTAIFTQFYYRLRDKIEHHLEGQFHAAHLLAEELRFFFGAQAAVIFLNDRCVHRSLTQREFETLTQKRGVGLQRSGVPTCRVETVSFSADEIKQIGANDNLSRCSSLVVASGLGDSAQWTIWIWSGTDGIESERLKLFQPPDSNPSVEFWSRLGSLLDLSHPSAVGAETKISSLSPPTNTSGLEDFLQEYEEQFLPLDSILEPLRRRITDELREYLTVDDSGVSCAFSVRHREEDAVHFYVTAHQARDAVKLVEDIEPLRAFSVFPYGPGEALSGWVMETGACLYLEDFTTSNLWSRYIEKGGLTNSDREAQLNRVAKFFRVNNGNLKHAYLIPVLLQQAKDAQGAFHLRTDLMLSITIANVLDVEMRRHIFELVQRLGSAVGVALAAQREYESVVGRAILAEKVQPLTRFISHQLSNRSNVLNGLIIVGSSISAETEKTCKFITEDIGNICQIAAAYHQYVQGGKNLPFEAIEDFSAFIGKVWQNARAEFISRDPRNTAIFDESAKPSVASIPKGFVIHRPSIEFLFRNLISNSIDALEGNSGGRITLEVKYIDTAQAVELSVEDNGPGITNTTADALLKRQQVSRIAGTDTDKQDGYSGFGWHFIWLFCDAHGAAPSFPITKESGASGCKVTVTFPVRRSSEAIN